MILILGGTREARELASALVAGGIDILSSLAGRVSEPALPAGPVRIGGFGGVGGLITFLRERRVRAVVDATHPFATRISAHAIVAAESTGVPLLRLERPSWRARPDADTWTWVGGVSEVLSNAPESHVPFLTTGRQSLREFLPWHDRAAVARVVDPPDFDPPMSWRIIQSRGPYDLASELTLLQDHGVDLLVTKDSGGTLTSAKLDAAAALGIPVVVISRPYASAAAYTSVAEVLVALNRVA